jgi:predicted nucleic acid-binding protein
MMARPASRARRVRAVARSPSLVLLDANVIFDMLVFRAPWHEDAIAIFEAVEDGRLRAVVASHTVTTLWYVLRRQSSDVLARSALRRLLSSLPVAAAFARWLGLRRSSCWMRT